MVLADSGELLQGARVCAFCATCDITSSPEGLCQVTDEGGLFSFAQVPAGSFNVSASLQGYGIGHAEGAPVVVRETVETEPVVIRMPKAETNLAGMVLDAAGGPLPGARVQLAPVTHSVAATAEILTDDDGRFAAAMPPGRIAIRASAEGYAPAITYRQTPSADVVLSLAPGGAIEGTIVDALSGRPVEGIDVRVAGNMAATLLASVRSDDAGNFRIEGLEPGQFLLEARGPNHSGRSQHPVPVGLGQSVSGVVVPVRGGTPVRGTVTVGESGEPCAEGHVQLGSWSPGALQATLGRSDGVGTVKAPSEVVAPIELDGRVRLDGVPPGEYHVALKCRGHVYREGPAVLQVADEPLDVRWVVDAGQGLKVLVTDESGEPVGGVRLSLQLPALNDSSIVIRPLDTDAQGVGELAGELYPGEYVLHLDSSYGVDPIPFELRRGDRTHELKVTVPGSAGLTVRVRNADGRLADGVDVVVRDLDESRQVRDHWARGIGGGEFVVAPLPAGRFDVLVTDGINPPGARGASTVSLRTGERATLEVTSECSASLSGVVVDAEGAPVRDVWVTAEHEADRDAEGVDPGLLAGRLARVLSDAQGRFVLPELCAQAVYTLRADSHDGTSGVAWEQRPGSDVRLQVQKPGSIAGRVLLPDGVPAQHFVVTVHNESALRTLGVEVESSDGRFELGGLPAGTLSIDVASDGWWSHRQVHLPQGEHVQDLVLQLSAARQAANAAEG